MRSVTAAITAITLLSSAALADTALPAGKPAGVKQANIFSGTPLYFTLGFIALGVAIGVATSQGRTGVTSSTSTAP